MYYYKIIIIKCETYEKSSATDISPYNILTSV